MQNNNDIRIQILGASITISLGSIISYLPAILANIPTLYKIVPVLILAGGFIWFISVLDKYLKVLSKSQSELIEKLDEFRRNPFGGSILSFVVRNEWLNTISSLIENAPEDSTIYDATCGPRRTKTRPTATDDKAIDRYQAALLSERHHIHEIYSSNWKKEIIELLEKKSTKNIGVLPCSSPQYMFSDFLVISYSHRDYTNDVFLSGLELGGQEINLWIKNNDAAAYFINYFNSLENNAWNPVKKGDEYYITNRDKEILLTSNMDCKGKTFSN